MVAWSDEIPDATVELVHYFGQDIVLWRGTSGRLFATDPYCLHLGANLGVRGAVEGDGIVCPWHHWQWDGDGKNTLIPYSAQRCKEHLRLKPWEVREQFGCVLLWHDATGSPPTWEPPAFEEMLDPSDYYPVTEATRIRWHIKAHPQMIIENGVDPAHIPYIHGAGVVPEVRGFEADGHRWITRVTASYGAGKESTWLTPEGRIDVDVEFRLWGVGMGAAIWPDELMGAVMPNFVTPVDDTYSDFWWHMTARRVPGSEDAMPKDMIRFMEHQRDTITDDFFIWEHMQTLRNPSFAPEEAKGFAAMRRWAWQFYPTAEHPNPGGTSA
jgi:phenylpropionate dioxygenase-like ring-hydroxylating dioxygenase large terminal subunit